MKQDILVALLIASLAISGSAGITYVLNSRVENLTAEVVRLKAEIARLHAVGDLSRSMIAQSEREVQALERIATAAERKLRRDREPQKPAS